jgi:Arc/MetJ-type ribon-helix-helix transcriptional regulator
MEVVMAGNPKPYTITVRLTEEQRERLEMAVQMGPYKLKLTEIIARGIELAAQEIERMEGRL